MHRRSAGPGRRPGRALSRRLQQHLLAARGRLRARTVHCACVAELPLTAGAGNCTSAPSSVPDGPSPLLFQRRDAVMQGKREEGEAQPRRRRGRHRPGREQDPDVRLSKALSYALRHGASQLGLELRKDGFLPVDAILQHPQYRRYTVQDVQRVVDTSDKRRFALRTDPATGALQIRANQGHTLQVEELELTPISLDGGNLPAQAIHGTYLRHWPQIKAHGLRRFSRQHLHLAPGLPEDGGVISGMRSSCEVAIFVELEKALSDGIPFFLSANHVILTPGNEDGVLSPKYFQKVLQLKPTRQLLPLQ